MKEKEQHLTEDGDIVEMGEVLMERVGVKAKTVQVLRQQSQETAKGKPKEERRVTRTTLLVLQLPRSMVI